MILESQDDFLPENCLDLEEVQALAPIKCEDQDDGPDFSIMRKKSQV